MIVAHKRAEVIPKTSLSSHLPIPPISPIPPIFTIATQLNQSQDCPKSEKHGIYFWTTWVPRPTFCRAFFPLVRGSSIFSQITSRLVASSRPVDRICVSFLCHLNLSFPWCSIKLASWQDQHTNTNHMTLCYRLWNRCFLFTLFNWWSALQKKAQAQAVLLYTSSVHPISHVLKCIFNPSHLSCSEADLQ